MTTIKCAEGCIYQQDGMCGLDSITFTSVKSNTVCAFFIEKEADMNGAKTYGYLHEI